MGRLPQQVQELASRVTTDELRVRNGARVLPGPTHGELLALEQRLPAPMPMEVRALLEQFGGIHEINAGPVRSIDFTGRSMQFEFVDAFPWGLPIADDLFGNFWVVDLTPKSEVWGPIFFACHDPASITLVAENLAAFLQDVRGALDESDGDGPSRRRLEGAAEHEYALANDFVRLHDRTLWTVDDSSDPSVGVVDLRHALPGDSFALWSLSALIEVQRETPERVFKLMLTKTRWGRLSSSIKALLSGLRPR